MRGEKVGVKPRPDPAPDELVFENTRKSHDDMRSHCGKDEEMSRVYNNTREISNTQHQTWENPKSKVARPSGQGLPGCLTLGEGGSHSPCTRMVRFARLGVI